MVMGEVFDLMGQANDVAETAKDAMHAKVLVADKTSQTLARTILKEAKTLVPNNRVVTALEFENGELDWSSIRSVMQAVSNALSSENMREANNRPRRQVGSGPYGWMR